VIENDVPFTVLGKAWVFEDSVAARIKILYREHDKRARETVRRNRRRKAVA
jgi:hypothetical protein